MANLYYRDDLAAAAFEAGAFVRVEGEEARHAVRVSRLRLGERIGVGNGAGAIGWGRATLVERDRFEVRLDEASHAPEAVARVSLIQALAKGDRDERAVEQATEFGADAIVPWQAERSVSRWDGAGAADKRAKGVAKWRRIAREASKQSLRPRIPEVSEPLGLPGLRDLAGRSRLLVLHPRGESTLSGYARELSAGGSGEADREIGIVVGPEGGLSALELDALANSGAVILRLGDTVLRTSSAGPAALAVLNVALGRW